MSIDTLIFDWDGTLADSIGHIVSTMQSAAVAVGLPVPSDEAVKGIIGLGLPEAAAVLFPQRPDLAVPVVDASRRCPCLLVFGRRWKTGVNKVICSLSQRVRGAVV